jgi:antirestriction protein
LDRVAVLEKILQLVRLRRERARIEKCVSAYYASLPDKEALEQAQWGEFASGEFPGES